ncbi:hypothetical protein OG921_01795 [Aldersonia sp. NBC_00410]|uniref:hypothetical protein n=1 Tax=Aldersonia sp. NBC_00410 TaxID=2975954 RepID=UPI00224CAFCD|nr:hypothetical protein [Aldersonia sp. NBC_00410]MCX5041926.1 hypothetical protein [Aldersonia sp. NBC_00410]
MQSRGAFVARMRGGFVGAVSGAVAIAAHGAAGGGMPPGQAAIVALVLACTAVGAVVANAGITERIVPFLLTVLAAGQLVGHTTLALTADHAHGSQLGTSMIGAHAAATVVAAALIRAAEHGCAAVLAALARIVVAILAPLRVRTPLWTMTPRERGTHALLLLTGSADFTRGPPALV